MQSLGSGFTGCRQGNVTRSYSTSLSGAPGRNIPILAEPARASRDHAPGFLWQRKPWQSQTTLPVSGPGQRPDKTPDAESAKSLASTGQESGGNMTIIRQESSGRRALPLPPSPITGRPRSPRRAHSQPSPPPSSTPAASPELRPSPTVPSATVTTATTTRSSADTLTHPLPDRNRDRHRRRRQGARPVVVDFHRQQPCRERQRNLFRNLQFPATGP